MNKVKECVDTINNEIDTKLEFTWKIEPDKKYRTDVKYNGKIIQFFITLREPDIEGIRRRWLRQIRESYDKSEGLWKTFINKLIAAEGGNNE